VIVAARYKDGSENVCDREQSDRFGWLGGVMIGGVIENPPAPQCGNGVGQNQLLLLVIYEIKSNGEGHAVRNVGREGGWEKGLSNEKEGRKQAGVIDQKIAKAWLY
jgi:hypothetical protein